MAGEDYAKTFSVVTIQHSLTYSLTQQQCGRPTARLNEANRGNPIRGRDRREDRKAETSEQPWGARHGRGKTHLDRETSQAGLRVLSKHSDRSANSRPLSFPPPSPPSPPPPLHTLPPPYTRTAEMVQPLRL